jgi:cation diffusion facilitator family transporter
MPEAAESKFALYGAIAANVAIAVTKFAVAAITGSSAMMSEAIHSLVDTGNGALLLVGVRRSQQPATQQHPFGYGKELYFWSLIVAVLIFGLGGGISFYQGVLRVRDPHPLENAFWNYIVLACAAVFEGASFALSMRQFARERGDTPFWEALHTSKNPATYTVIAEDSAALAGLAIAAAGVYASHRLHMPRLDGVASMAIGLLLAGVAVLLIRESRGLLIGEGIRPDTAVAIRQLVAAEPGVVEVGHLLSMYVGPDEALLTFEVVFDADVPASDIAATIRHVEQAIRERFHTLRRIYIEPVRSTAR